MNIVGAFMNGAIARTCPGCGGRLGLHISGGRHDPHISGIRCLDCGMEWTAADIAQGSLAVEHKAGRGVKDDAGKPRMELLPMGALLEVAKVLTYGAEKYAPGNWKQVPDAEGRYQGALLRHLAAYMDGERHDSETGEAKLLHIAQAAANALFLTYFELHKEEKVDG